MRRWRSDLAVSSLALAVMCVQGCATGPGGAAERDTGGAMGADPSPAQVAGMPTEPKITGVRVFHPSYGGWQWTEDKQRIRGIKVGPVYLVGPKGKGVFGDGVIRPKLYRLDRGADHKVIPTLIQEWSFTVEEAIPLRIKKPNLLGWGYGLPLVWENADLLDKAREVRVVVEFERSDGGTVTSTRKDLQVPMGAY